MKEDRVKNKIVTTDTRLQALVFYTVIRLYC